MDLEEQRAVAESLVSEFADARGIAHYETSAKTGENVDSVFVALAESIFKVNKSFASVESSRSTTRDTFKPTHVAKTKRTKKKACSI